jgi:CDP-paratose 2-epimerase
MKTILITGASGLIGSEVARFFLAAGHRVVGIDNNMRKTFFGIGGDTSSVTSELCKTPHYTHEDSDIRDFKKILEIFGIHKPDYIVHTAAQPSHDLAAKIPHDDFATNAVGTLNVLESARLTTPESPFVHVSTNKVYGDTPNRLNLIEKESRFDYADEKYCNGINESMSIDQTTHSLFGVSKTSADLLAQEYARYFGMPVGVFRGGCLTGPQHAGVELHGFLSYIVKCAVKGTPYTIYGHKGKQVRDQIHSYDVCTAFHEFMKNPRPGEVYNIGGGVQNNASILETIDILSSLGHKLDFNVSDKARIGDHICYISDMSKFRSHYPSWNITKTLPTIVAEIIDSVRTN